MSSINTSIGKWSNLPYRPDIISSNDIINHVHSIELSQTLPGPDFSRRKECNFSKFKLVNASNTNINWVFKLLYPCFYVASRTSFGALDNDVFMLLSKKFEYAISFYHSDYNVERYNAACRRDSTYQIYYSSGNQPLFNGFPLGALDYWYHIASGSIGSNDDSDNTKYYRAFLIPYFGTPVGTPLAAFYNATYQGVKALYNSSNTILISHIIDSLPAESSCTIIRA